MEKINYAVTIQVAGGPAVPLSGVLEVDAYEKISAAVPGKAGGTDGKIVVVVSPSDLAHTQLMVITSSATDGSVQFKTTAAGASAVPVTGPLTLIGPAACSLLATNPDKLTFTNSDPHEAAVTILIGRKAVG